MTKHQDNPMAQNLKAIICDEVSTYSPQLLDASTFQAWLEQFLELYIETGLSQAVSMFELSETLFRSVFYAFEDKVLGDDMTDEEWNIALGAGSEALAIGLILKAVRPLQV